MAQVNPQSFKFHIKQEDLNPPLKIKIYDSDTELPFDLTDYTGKFYMALKTSKSTAVINGSTVTITDAAEGEAEYRWSDGDTDDVGEYYFEFRFTIATKTFTLPVVSPGVIVIESKIGI